MHKRYEKVTEEERELFDRFLEAVIEPLPDSIHEKLEEIPLIVEDHPGDAVLQELDVQHPADLCGLHTGIPLTDRSVEHSGVLSDVIHLFRRGIINQSLDPHGRIDEVELKRQIRITLLHEIGHHFGLDEDDLNELGYG